METTDEADGVLAQPHHHHQQLHFLRSIPPSVQVSPGESGESGELRLLTGVS